MAGLGKNQTVRRIDQAPSTDGAATVIAGTIAPVAAPPISSNVPAPTGLTLTTGLTIADRSASAFISAVWNAPVGYDPASYVIGWATDAGFTANTGGFSLTSPDNDTTAGTTILGARPGTVYYVRVAAVSAGGQLSAWNTAGPLTTAQDVTPPAQPTVTSTALQANGDLVIVGTNPASANFAQVEFAVRGSSSGPTYAIVAVPGQPGAAFRFVWPAAENVRLAGGGDPTLSIDVVARSFAGYASAPLTVSASKAIPNAPTITATWDGAAGWLMFSGSYDTQTALALTLDGVTRVITLPYAYDLATNRREHSGTASASIAWSAYVVDPLNQVSAATSGTATLARPATPSGVSATWDGASGTCTFVWSPVSSVATYRLTIDTIARSVGDTRYAYVLGQNRQEHGGVVDPVLDWALVAVDGLGQTSTTAATGTATLARPATPGSVVTDFASATAVWQWGVVSAIVGYRLTIDGIARDLGANRYDYGFALNIQEHSGTPDPVLTWSLVAVDALGQTSTTPASGTLTNPVPSAPTAISIIGGATGFFISITPAVPSDFRDYTVRIILNSVTLETITRTTSAFAYQATGSGTYTVGVIVNDVFGQASTEYVTPAGAVVDVLLPAELRADCVYTDSSATASATLAGLKDDNRTTNVVNYASGTPWKWTEAKRSGATRVGNLAITATAGVGYVGISEDGTTYTWFSGPLAADLETLTQVASEAAAQTAAVALPTTTTGVWRLPTTQSARYVRLGHRNTSATYTLREFYPPTLVVADNIRAGLIRGMRVVANQLVADELAAISAALGAVDLSGVCTIGANGGIWQGSAGTFASPTTGYKLYRSSTGKGLWETWLGGVKQVYIADDMGLYAGAGNIWLNSTALNLLGKNSVDDSNPVSIVRWQRPDASTIGSLAAEYDTTLNKNRMRLSCYPLTPTSGQQAQIRLSTAGVTLDLFSQFGSESIFSIGTGGTAAAIAASSTTGVLVTGDVDAPRAFKVSQSMTIGPYTIIGSNRTDAVLAATANDLILNAPNGSGGAIKFLTNGVQRGYIDSGGNIYAGGALIASNQTTYSLTAGALALSQVGYYTNASFQASAQLIAGGDIYLGSRSTWLTSYLNQAVTTSASPTFTGLSVAGRIIADSDNNAGGGISAAALNFANGGEAIGNPRTAGASNQYGLDFYTNSIAHFAIGNSGIMSMGGGGISGYGLTSNQRLRIHSTGDTSSHYPLAVVTSDGSTSNFLVRGDGACTYRTSMTAISDIRQKRDITAIPAAEIARLGQVRPVAYQLIGGDRRQRGVIAQDIQEVYPDLVYEGSDGLLSMDYSGLIPLLLASHQQLMQRVAALEAQ